METFSSEFRRIHREREALTRIEEALPRLTARQVESSDSWELSPVSKLPSKIFDLLQIGLRRTTELTEASIREMNRRNVSSTCVLVRDTFETTCLIFDATRQVTYAADHYDVAIAKPVVTVTNARW